MLWGSDNDRHNIDDEQCFISCDADADDDDDHDDDDDDDDDDADGDDDDDDDDDHANSDWPTFVGGLNPIFAVPHHVNLDK